MAYSYALNNVYNHYLTTYAPKGTNRYDTHKKSELRGIYNSIVKLNKESPLSIVDTSEGTQQFAVDLKENARELHNTIASLGGLDEEDLLNRKTAYSSNEAVATAKFVGQETPSEEDSSFTLSVKQLAEPQVNTGNYLSNDKMELAAGTYSFDVAINNLNYEFQFNIHEGNTNGEIQNKLARLINSSNIGLKAEVREYDSDTSALRLESTATGIEDGKSLTFSVSDDRTSKSSGAVEYFGLKNVSKEPQNAVFSINDTEHQSFTNSFTVAKTFELNLNSIQPEGQDEITIGLKTDVDSLTENVTHLIGGYNDFLRAASSYLDSQPKTEHIIGEMNRISSYYSNDLSQIGLFVNEDGTISVDNQQLSGSVTDADARELFSSVRNFTNSVLNKTNQISLSPMDYVQKTIVAYKNPGKNFATPYITSQYSGMMFNSYC